jgi:hypothetical protein
MPLEGVITTVVVEGVRGSTTASAERAMFTAGALAALLNTETEALLSPAAEGVNATSK